jgi:hypothetical protein
MGVGIRGRLENRGFTSSAEEAGCASWDGVRGGLRERQRLRFTSVGMTALRFEGEWQIWVLVWGRELGQGRGWDEKNGEGTGGGHRRHC